MVMAQTRRGVRKSVSTTGQTVSVGSHIPKVHTSDIFPARVIDRSEIEASGHQLLGDFLRDLPLFILGVKRGRFHHFPAIGATYTGIRGQYSGDLLILINKTRVASMGSKSYVDLSVIPLVAIERIEILKDGASALYGSDAGAVMNIVTRSHFKGMTMSVDTSLAQRDEGNRPNAILSFLDFPGLFSGTESLDGEDISGSFYGKGDQFSWEMIKGGDTGNMEYVLAGELKVKTPLYFRDRNFGVYKKEDLTWISSPGTYKAQGSAWQAAPGCPLERIERGCDFDRSLYRQFIPQEIHLKTFLHTEQPFGAGTLKTHTVYSLIRANLKGPAVGGKFTNFLGLPDHRIPAATFNKMLQDASNYAGGGVGSSSSVAGPVKLLYRLVDEKGSGPEQDIVWNHFLQTHAQWIRPWGKWNFETNANLSGWYNMQTAYNQFNEELLFKAIQDGSFNPLLPKEKKNDVSSARYEKKDDSFAGVINLESRVSGELAAINKKPVLFATGVLAGWQYYLEETDDITLSGKQFGNNTLGIASGSGGRMFGNIYGELFSEVSNKTRLQLAGHIDAYQGFGLLWHDWNFPFTDFAIPLPFSPKATLTYQLSRPLKFTASYGLGFQAPDMDITLGNEYVTYRKGRSKSLCAEKNYKYKKTLCDEDTYFKVITQSNPIEEPALTKSFNLGLAFNPVDQLSFGMNWYRYQREGGAYFPPLWYIFEYEAEHGIQKLRSEKMDIKRKADGTVEHIIIHPLNTERLIVHGLELDAALYMPIGSGWTMGFHIDHSHLLYRESQSMEDAVIRTQVPFYSWMKNLFGVEDGEEGIEGICLLMQVIPGGEKNSLLVWSIKPGARLIILLYIIFLRGYKRDSWGMEILIIFGSWIF